MPDCEKQDGISGFFETIQGDIASAPSGDDQLAQAILMYAQDYDERFPVANFSDTTTGFPPWTHLDSTGNAIFIDKLLNPYVKNEGIFWCPTMRGQPNRAHQAALLVATSPAISPSTSWTTRWAIVRARPAS